jgi:hypothetical protein
MDLSQYITKSIRGREKIVFDGYSYNYKECSGEKMHWRCNQRNCLAVLHTSLQYILISLTVHNHERQQNKLNARNLIEKVKQRALETSESSRDVVINILSQPENLNNYDVTAKYLQQQVKKQETKQILHLKCVVTFRMK